MIYCAIIPYLFDTSMTFSGITLLFYLLIFYRRSTDTNSVSPHTCLPPEPGLGPHAICNIDLSVAKAKGDNDILIIYTSVMYTKATVMSSSAVTQLASLTLRCPSDD